MAIEIELGVKREIRGDFEVTGAAEHLIMKIDVILFDRFPALIEPAEGLAGLGCQFPGDEGSHRFFVGDDAVDKVLFPPITAGIVFFDIPELGAIDPARHPRRATRAWEWHVYLRTF